MNSIHFCALILTFILTLFVAWYFLKWLFPKPLVSDFKNKFVLITGCDSGFGRMSAIRLDKMGFHVIGTCLTKEGKENLESVCSDRLVGMLMNVTDSKQIHDVFVKAKDIVDDKGIWAVVNNAGFMTVGPIEWYKMEDFRKMADVNLWGLIEVTKTFLPLVKKAQGRIVNFSSILGLVGWNNMAPYCITKYGVEAFSDTLRREMKRWKVKVCIIEPQGFETPLLDEMFEKKLDRLWDGVNDEIKKEYREIFTKMRDGRGREALSKGISPDVHLVINAVVDAVANVDPSPRYLVGPFAKFVALISHLPTVLQDKCVG